VSTARECDGDAEDIAINGEVAALETALAAGNVRIVMIDTVVAHIPTQHDTYKEQNVRAVLNRWQRWPSAMRLAVLGVMHLNRREARDILTRISGSGAFGTLARSVLLWAARLHRPHASGVEIPTVRLIDAGPPSERRVGRSTSL
jgi:hypothetical protein